MKDIFIIEDEIIVAKSIESILKNNGYKISGIATSYEEAREFLKFNIPNLILCDINLSSDNSGIQLMEEISPKYNIPFIFISAYDSKEMVKAAMNTKPLNYITKPFNEKQLLVSVATAFDQIVCDPKDHPTEKETHILQLIAQGLSSKEIAIVLSLSYHTVETHRKNMLNKYHVKNITNLVFLATTKGWIKS